MPLSPATTAAANRLGTTLAQYDLDEADIRRKLASNLGISSKNRSKGLKTGRENKSGQGILHSSIALDEIGDINQEYDTYDADLNANSTSSLAQIGIRRTQAQDEYNRIKAEEDAAAAAAANVILPDPTNNPQAGGATPPPLVSVPETPMNSYPSQTIPGGIVYAAPPGGPVPPPPFSGPLEPSYTVPTDGSPFVPVGVTPGMTPAPVAPYEDPSSPYYEGPAVDTPYSDPYANSTPAPDPYNRTSAADPYNWSGIRLKQLDDIINGPDDPSDPYNWKKIAAIQERNQIIGA